MVLAAEERHDLLVSPQVPDEPERVDGPAPRVLIEDPPVRYQGSVLGQRGSLVGSLQRVVELRVVVVNDLFHAFLRALRALRALLLA